MDENRDNCSSRMEELRERQFQAWQNSRPLFVEGLTAGRASALTENELMELIYAEITMRTELGEACKADEYVRRFPELTKPLERLFEIHNFFATKEADPRSDSPIPRRIGRYRIERILGKGGFGIVYLGYDEQLTRSVAVKVPHAHLTRLPKDVEAYRTEARTVANLDHPNIVTVYDVGSTTEFPCYIVSKFIEGGDLATRLKQFRLSMDETVQLVATVAEALDFAHRKGLVHRDVKPGNILLDRSGNACVVDFGLALREQDVGNETVYAGTPAYMSPEQHCGEGHRVDGRSDIFSLGVVFYELLVAQRPFQGETTTELIEQITSFEPRPPRMHEDQIPQELDRICLKALSKRASERYSTAKDMADDLRHFLAGSARRYQIRPSEKQMSAGTSRAANNSPMTPTKIVPKGLRSFDAHDADFFLELLPGPRDREGLPESIRFWKTRIEETDADNTFSVGLIYGPSGCGKSSLVKAGLLPRLSDDVISIYVESSAEETETRLLRGLQKRCPVLQKNWSLKESLAALRRGQETLVGKKLFLVLDQFEQWLHANKNEKNTELVQALRQCDGGQIQCVIMVRDDFWMAATRFMQELEVRLSEDQNAVAVDLFDVDHARKVLAAFGRAFGKLPENIGDTGKEQTEFLNLAVSGLAQDGKVISVRLALFAEMMKGKPWTPTALKEVGGAEGVGVAFLDETFSRASTAPPEHRYHQKGARGVLKLLLPESGTDIKGHMRSYAELLEASGYASRSKEFGDLIRILDREIRLITPIDPEGAVGDGWRLVGKKNESEASSPATHHAPPTILLYQLTHDYLVPSLRVWLTQKQKETRRGRAELLLEDRAAAWNSRTEYRQLPSFSQWLRILWWTRKKDSTQSQRTMMAKAGRCYAVQVAVVGLILVFATFTGLTVRNHVIQREKENYATSLVDAIVGADLSEVPGLVLKMADDPLRVTPRLIKKLYEVRSDPRQELNVSLALLSVDGDQVKYLWRRLLDAPPDDMLAIRDALVSHRAAWAEHATWLQDKSWDVLDAPEKGKESQRLRAGAALAMFDPNEERWSVAGAVLVDDLVLESPVYFNEWRKAFFEVKEWLIPELSNVFRNDTPERSAERNLATNMLAHYATDRRLADLLMDADVKQFAIIYSQLQKHVDRGVPILLKELGRELEPTASNVDKLHLAKRKANASVALLKDQPEKLWPLLEHREDSTLRSYLIHRFGPLSIDGKVIIKRFHDEQNITIRRALLLSLGEYDEHQLSFTDRETLKPRLKEMSLTEDDPGLRAAAEWLLRQWQEETWLEKSDDDWASNQARRDERLRRIQQRLKTDNATPQWYVNSQGQAMLVIPGPVTFLKGSPTSEADRMGDEVQYAKSINRTFAIAASPVTKKQFSLFDAKHTSTYSQRNRYPFPTCPIGGVNWYTAAKYCNWLSKVEMFPENEWCYEIDETGTKLKNKYLTLTGYRLPTEAEMEFATRARSTTACFFGQMSNELQPKYARYSANSDKQTWPVGSLKPNDFGMFDTYGGVFNWCQESYNSRQTYEDTEDDLVIVGSVKRGLRGCSFLTAYPGEIRSAYRNSSPPDFQGMGNGFRVARTLPSNAGQ